MRPIALAVLLAAVTGASVREAEPTPIAEEFFYSRAANRKSRAVSNDSAPVSDPSRSAAREAESAVDHIERARPPVTDAHGRDAPGPTASIHIHNYMNGGERRGRDPHHGDLRATPQGPSMIHRVPALLGLPYDREADGSGAHELQSHSVVEPEMHSAVQRFEPLKPLATRAFILYVLLRLLVGGIGAAGARLGAASPDSPAGIVLLVAVLGAIDIWRRGESLLWANLGYSTMVTWGLFAAVALSGELFLFVLRS